MAKKTTIQDQMILNNPLPDWWKSLEKAEPREGYDISDTDISADDLEKWREMDMENIVEDFLYRKRSDKGEEFYPASVSGAETISRDPDDVNLPEELLSKFKQYNVNGKQYWGLPKDEQLDDDVMKYLDRNTGVLLPGMGKVITKYGSQKDLIEEGSKENVDKGLNKTLMKLLEESKGSNSPMI